MCQLQSLWGWQTPLQFNKPQRIVVYEMMQGLDRLADDTAAFNQIVLDQSSAILDLSINVILELVVCST